MVARPSTTGATSSHCSTLVSVRAALSPTRPVSNHKQEGAVIVARPYNDSSATNPTKMIRTLLHLSSYEPPHSIEYTYTIPYFECVADVQQCIKVCPQADNGCYTTCNARNCTAEFPKKYNQTIATSISSTPTAGPGSPQITALPPGIFGSSGNMNRGVQTWTALGGSSVLGLVVFLTVGVLFGNQME